MDLLLTTSSKLGYDILSEHSPVPANVLCQAEKLQWQLTTDSIQDVQVAKKNLDGYVYIPVGVYYTLLIIFVTTDQFLSISLYC